MAPKGTQWPQVVVESHTSLILLSQCDLLLLTSLLTCSASRCKGACGDLKGGCVLGVLQCQLQLRSVIPKEYWPCPFQRPFPCMLCFDHQRPVQLLGTLCHHCLLPLTSPHMQQRRTLRPLLRRRWGSAGPGMGSALLSLLRNLSFPCGHHLASLIRSPQDNRCSNTLQLLPNIHVHTPSYSFELFSCATPDLVAANSPSLQTPCTT